MMEEEHLEAYDDYYEVDVFSESEDFITEEEWAKILKDQYVVEDDDDLPILPAVTPPRGHFYRDAYVAPDINRDVYIRQLYTYALDTNFADYTDISGQTFIHSDYTGSLDFYYSDFVDALHIMKSYYGPERLYIINGFRHPSEVGINPHGVGIACDIHVDSWEHARKIMSAAHIAGIPTIIPAGSIENGQGHIHLDLAPTADYTYDAGEYAGPWS